MIKKGINCYTILFVSIINMGKYNNLIISNVA